MIASSGPPTASPGGTIVPEWLINIAALGWRVIAVLALALAVAVLCSILWTVTASIAVATVVAALFAPWVTQLYGRARRRQPARPA